MVATPITDDNPSVVLVLTRVVLLMVRYQVMYLHYLHGLTQPWDHAIKHLAGG